MNKENYKNYPEAMTIACMYKIEAIDKMYSSGCFVDEISACKEEIGMIDKDAIIFNPILIKSAYDSAYNFPDNGIYEAITRKWWCLSDIDDYETFKSML